MTLDIAVKRIMQEARELANDPCTDYAAAPLEVCFISMTFCCAWVLTGTFISQDDIFVSGPRTRCLEYATNALYFYRNGTVLCEGPLVQSSRADYTTFGSYCPPSTPSAPHLS